MRIWDVDPTRLCRSHLVGEHREIHAVWTILTEGRSGYARHAEVRRWDGKLAALYTRHEEVVAEMARRGYGHRSRLDPALATGAERQDQQLASTAEQLVLLAAKGCDCQVEP